LVISLSAALAFGSVNLGAVTPGDSGDSVRGELGRPNGQIEFGTTRVLFYKRGDVILRDGRVVGHSIMSEREYTDHLRREADKKALLARRAEEIRLQREAEGLALKQSKLNDRAFASLPAVERVTFWRTFKKRYPMVAVDLEFSGALAEYESARLIASNRALASKINQLETRLYEAERNLYQSRRTSGFGYWGGGTYSGGYSARSSSDPSGRPPGHRPDQPAGSDSNHDFHSTRGAIMSTMDRARGRYDSSYGRSRAAFYSRISP